MADRVSLSRRWVAVAVWMAIIFWFSHQSSLPLPTTGQAVWDIALRKGGHAFFYAVLGILLLRALSPPRQRPGLRLCCLAIALAAGYAITDEIHQSLIPGRRPHVSDVLIDTAGAALAVALRGWSRSRMSRGESRLDPRPKPPDLPDLAGLSSKRNRGPSG